MLIALIDDDPQVRDSYTGLLQSAGHQTQCFESAEEFLKSAPAGGIDCLIVDYRLPGVTGCELLKHLRQQQDSTPAILLTGSVDAPERSLWAGIAGVRLLRKPSHADELFGLVDAMCGRH